MQSLDVVVESSVALTPRLTQVSGMFDCPVEKKQRLEWHHKLPLDEFDWNVGLIVGPSGCGKTLCARSLFGDLVDRRNEWDDRSVVDNFPTGLSIQTIADVCSSVGFSTIPAWMRQFAVLSNGEQFRVDIARRLASEDRLVVVDEFTSVVDRQVAKIVSHCVQKVVRKQQRQFVAVSCHEDIADWLQPDWVFSPADGGFIRRSLQRRPPIELAISRVGYSAWSLFSRYHYLTANLHKAAKCFCAFVAGRPVAFLGVLHFPHPRRDDIMRNSRAVTLPDYQGLGIAFALVDTIAAAYRAIGKNSRSYPAHPSYTRSFARAANWKMTSAPTKNMKCVSAKSTRRSVVKSRPGATFEYVGPALSLADARALLGT